MREGYATCAGGVKLYYRAAGDPAAPLLVLIHGFPDDSRTWSPILTPLAERFHVVTPDCRGYSQSDKPDGVSGYRMEHLVADVIGLLDHLGRESATLVGHDWGAIIAQNVAIRHPARVGRLVLLNMPHLNGVARELATNRQQQAASWYARLFQNEIPLGPIDWKIVGRQLADPSPRGFHVLCRSSVEGLLNYYRANFPRPPYRYDRRLASRLMIHAPTLIVFGLGDPYVLPAGLDDNRRWFAGGLNTVTHADAGHWVHHDAPTVVADVLHQWLGA
jgi:epoxide hydrolase 4